MAQTPTIPCTCLFVVQRLKMNGSQNSIMCHVLNVGESLARGIMGLVIARIIKDYETRPKNQSS